jgi:RNA polymerase sigma-70 factor (family 1)
LQGISDGDEKAFAILFNHYYPLIRPFVWKFTQSARETEEILQEIFIKIWLHRYKITEIEHLRAWIFKIASRECLYTLRKNLHYRQKMAALQQIGSINTPDDTPAELTHAAEISRIVQRAVDQMPVQRKRIYQMSRDEGMKPGEIAEALSLSVSTVKNVLTTSLKYIKDRLAAAGHIFLLICSLFVRF